MAAMPYSNLSRRSFLAISATLPWALRNVASGLAPKSKIPVGLELYSVRDELKKDLEGTVRAVAKMGYQDVEFYAPYFDWSEQQAKQMRKLLDDLGIQCYSTHNDEDFFSSQKIDKARDLNKILGAKYMVQAWSDPKPELARQPPKRGARRSRGFAPLRRRLSAGTDQDAPGAGDSATLLD